MLILPYFGWYLLAALAFSFILALICDALDL